MLILVCAFGGLRRCRSGCSFNLHDRSAAQDAWLRLLCRRQVGLASDKAQYIHRLGRTARAGKSGKGMLLLGDFEERFPQQSAGAVHRPGRFAAPECLERG